MHGLLDAEEETPEGGHRSHPLWEVSARGLEYHETWRWPIRWPKHINITELQAFVTEESRTANPFPASRILFGLDSQVSLGAVVKHGMCFAIGGDVYSLPTYYNTASNRADNPTRGLAPKPPDLDLPLWFSELEWLAAVGAPSAGAELPFEDICRGQDLTFALQLW